MELISDSRLYEEEDTTKYSLLFFVHKCIDSFQLLDCYLLFVCHVSNNYKSVKVATRPNRILAILILFIFSSPVRMYELWENVYKKNALDQTSKIRVRNFATVHL